jgi:putative spermidine/putrescine transport system permease protein
MTVVTADQGPDAAAAAAPVLGGTLKQQLRRSLRARKIRALMLVLPLLAFVLITFLMPIGDMLFRSVENQIVPDTLPRTVEALAGWDLSSVEAPDEPVFAALHADLVEAVAARTHTRLGSRLNYENAGASGLFRKTGRDVADMDPALPLKEQFIESDREWGQTSIWRTIQLFSGAYTSGYLLNAADLQRTTDGVEAKPENERIYIRLFIRTLVMSLTITAFCALLGYPVAYLLASLPMHASNFLMILVLLPFWTSLLVRTASWKVLLQQQGVINDLLVWSGAISNAGRLVMINNATGTIIAMTHILLPFMILPLYSVMKGISPSYVRAAKSLGANDWTAFWRVYFPQSIPGLGAGGILVFILSIGYYITPELVGGTSGIFISNRIAFHISSSLNWGLAAALATLLLVVVIALYWTYDRVVGIDNVKLN